MPADLHIHTSFSDGTYGPEDVVKMAKEGGLTTIAITDHDNISAFKFAQAAGQKYDLEIIPGIELTTEDYGSEIHILGYFLDSSNPDLLRVIKEVQKGREERIYKICDKLKNLGINLGADKVFALSGHGAPGRPHVARALIKEGWVVDFKEAFNKYLKFDGPAYVSHYKISPPEAIKLILGSGGIPVFGHPAVSNCDEAIPDLVSAGLLGLEVYYLSHSNSQVSHYHALAEKHNLLETGGSDFHGLDSGRDVILGQFRVPDKLVEQMKREHACRN